MCGASKCTRFLRILKKYLLGSLSLSQQLFTEITFMKRYDGFYVVGHESVVPKNLVYAFSFIRNGWLSEHNNAGTWGDVLYICVCVWVYGRLLCTIVWYIKCVCTQHCMSECLCMCVCALCLMCIYINGIYKFLGFHCWVSPANTHTNRCSYTNVTIYAKYKNHPHVFG